MTRPTLLNYVTCPFGKPGDWAAGYHTGIDYRAAVGTKVFATRAGNVIHAGSGGSYGSAYGNYVVLQTWDGKRSVQHLYAHLKAVKVKYGDKVTAGDVIGWSGESGNTFGPHLHYEERTSPFGYYNHRRPEFPQWRPSNKKWLQIVLKKIGVLK